MTRIVNLPRLWNKSSLLLMLCFKCFCFVTHWHRFRSKVSEEMTQEKRSINIPAVVNAFDNGLGADEPVVEVLRILTKLSDG